MVPVSEIRALDIGIPGTRKKEGVMIGGLSGLLLGAAIGSTFQEDEPLGLLELTNDGKGGFWGFIIGATVGAFIGNRLPTIRWESIDVDSLQINARALDGGSIHGAAYMSF